MFRRSSRLLAAGVFVLAGITAWFALRPSAPTTEPAPNAPANSIALPPPTPPTSDPSASLHPPTPPDDTPPAVPPTPIDDILTNNSLDTLAAARALGALVADTRQSLEVRTEALTHFLNLSVEHETELVLPLIKNTGVPDALVSTLLSDSLNRPLSWQAEAHLAAMARPSPNLDFRQQVREHLVFLIETDHGDNLAAWTQAVREARAKWDAPAEE